MSSKWELSAIAAYWYSVFILELLWLLLCFSMNISPHFYNIIPGPTDYM